MTTRSFMPGDQEKIIQLLLAYRTGGNVMRYPTVWRLQLLLDSRVWDLEQDIRLWEDTENNLTACALLWKRQREGTYYALERILHPDMLETELPSAMLDWAIGRTGVESLEKATKLSLSVFLLQRTMEHDIYLLEAQGFSRNTAGYNVYMTMALDTLSTSTNLPDGFQLLPLTEADLEAYQATYGFTPVTIEHQRALLHNREYQHFIVKAPDGQLAAYLECSFSRAEWAQNQQRAGWIDYIETQPPFQHLKLAQFLMLHAFEHLRTQGANRIMLITRHDNQPAQSLFKKVGMEFDDNEYIYEKEIDTRSMEVIKKSY
ncbi:MAG TPA: GNAT family N-acetyltransferase [Aggregatilineales bacterium]|nr:GNAT family N-acetyltransferase [Anaerolineales bacterium]HRE48505.1 GNAT family N-acetyltransferase [Aggregatilineales bacterium]